MKHCLTNNAQIYVTIAFGLICISPVMNSPHYYQRRQISFFSRHIRPEKMDFFDDAATMKGGNKCPETEPWPCRTVGQCLAFDFICDNRKDCDDGFDELPQLCTAKNRPPKSFIRHFIKQYKDYMIPDVFGDETSIDTIADLLTKTPTLKEFANKLKLTTEQIDTLYILMESALYGRSIEPEMMGFPDNMWPSLEFIFGRIARSGFLKDS